MPLIKANGTTMSGQGWLSRGISFSLALCCLWSAQAAADADGPEMLVYQGVARHYVMHKVPSQTGPLPAVIALHGLNQPVSDLRGSWTLEAVADREGFDVVYPEALAGRWAYADSRPVALPDGGHVEDVGFILSLFDQLTRERIIDADHVYVVGVSNGGLMAWTLACVASERIAAVAPLITGMIERQTEVCRPKRLVPLVAIAGTDDWMQAYDGALTPELRLLSVPETLEFWRRLRGCTGRKVTEVPGHEPADPTAAMLVEWTECKDASPQRFFRIEGGGHSLPSFAPLSKGERRPHGGRSQAIETAEELWRFFHGAAP